jgi:predicted ATP-binding protein involved in virulence
MIVTNLQLINVRGIDEAEFTFKPGFNLIVGVNGVGKTTVLDAMRICFSRVVPKITSSKSKAMSFERNDIRLGFPFLNAIARFEVGGREFAFERREWREAIATDSEENLKNMRRAIIEAERLRDRPRTLLRELATTQTLDDSDFYSPGEKELKSTVAKDSIPPLVVFYSTSRSVISASQSKAKSVGGAAAGYAEALLPRTWNIEQFSDWIRVQDALSSESKNAASHISAMKAAAMKFLPGCSDIAPGESAGSSLAITKAGLKLDVRQLSDGERGALGIALDLARRLSQVNPGLMDPLKDGEAIVLIDEIDLHLHPKWQRLIVKNLTETFPSCQFIATSHSPQVIGEVESERIQVIHIEQESGKTTIYSPEHSFGVDSSRVLEEIMDAPARTSKVQELLDKLSKLVASEKFQAASDAVDQLAEQLGEQDAEVIRARTLLDFLGDEE